MSNCLSLRLSKNPADLLRWKQLILLAALSFICAERTANAEMPSFLTFHVGGGVSPLVGQISQRLDTGWHGTAGVGINVTSAFEATLDFGYHGLGVKDSVLREFEVPEGNASLWSLTVNPKLRFPVGSRVHPYIVGGIGYYRRTVEFTQPTIAEGIVFDPFFEAFFSVPFVEHQVLGRISRNGVGGSGGGGLEIGLGSEDRAARFYTEVRYEYADTGRIPTRMIPVTFGIRW